MEALATVKTISIFPIHCGRQLALEQFPSLAGDLPVRDSVRLAFIKEHDMTHQVDPITYAYLAGGCFMATSFGAAVEVAEELGLSQVDLLQGVTEMATTIEPLYLHVGAKFDGCFAYDVAERLGAWYSDYVAHQRQLPMPDQIKVEGCRLLAIEPPSDEAMALDRIQYLLSGQEWNPDHLDAVAAIVRGTGREIKDCDDTVDDAA